MIELYKLTAGNTVVAAITANVTSVSYRGDTYQPTAVKRSQIISRPDLLQNKVMLELSVHTPLGLQLQAKVNNNLLHKLTIYRGADVSSMAQFWAGSLTEQSCDGEIAKLTYGGGGIALRQLGDRRPFQRRCPFVLYDSLTCRATPSVTGARVRQINQTNDVLSVTGLDGFDVGYFTGGVVSPVFPYSATNADNRFISSHNKEGRYDQLRLSVPMADTPRRNARLTVLAGCDRTWQTCHTKFDNIVNFGGFPYLPLENPYIAEVCSDDGATVPILALDRNYAFLLALDNSGSMQGIKQRVAIQQVKFLLDNILEGLEQGSGTMKFGLSLWSSASASQFSERSIQTDSDVNFFKNILDSDSFEGGSTQFEIPFTHTQFFVDGNNASRRNIMLFITDGQPSNADLPAAVASPIVSRTAPLAPPLDVDVYAINIQDSDTAQTERIVNTNTRVPVVSEADPDLYYRVLFFEDRAAQ